MSEEIVTRKAQLVDRGHGKKISSTRAFNPALIASYILKKGHHPKGVTMTQIASLSYGRATKCNKKYVRSRISVVFKLLLEQGHLCVYILDPKNRHGLILAIKLYDHSSASDRAEFERRFDIMQRRKIISEKTAEQMLNLKASLDKPPTEEPPPCQ